jgi:hypothetical protein
MVSMFLKEEKILKLDAQDLKNFQKDLEVEMDKLYERFTGGTLRLSFIAIFNS